MYKVVRERVTCLSLSEFPPPANWINMTPDGRWYAIWNPLDSSLQRLPLLSFLLWNQVNDIKLALYNFDIIQLQKQRQG
jgi:hypothetical protein